MEQSKATAVLPISGRCCNLREYSSTKMCRNNINKNHPPEREDISKKKKESER